MPGFKIKEGQTCGKNGVVLYKRLYKDDKENWFCEFICPFCGNHFVAKMRSISSGDKKSCGCQIPVARQKFGDLHHKDLTGQVFGELTVLYSQEERSKDGRYLWHCICSCGKEVDVNSHALISGTTKSCGHLLQETTKKYRKDLIGQHFGYLTVIKDTGKSYRGKKQSHAIWLCQCERDGNFIEVRADDLKSGKVISCGCMARSYYSTKVEKCLKKYFQVVKEKTFEDCINPKTNYRLRFDFYLPDYNCCIEYDGEQHYKEVSICGDSLEDRQYRDRLKDEYCLKKHIHLIRIPFWDRKKINEQYIYNLVMGNIND